jgi:hypothetical protein
MTPLKQAGAKMIFKGTDLMANGALRDGDVRGRHRKREVTGDGLEGS